MNKQTLSILATLSVFSLCTSASELDTPNTFQAGTPARASEVNENFSAAETAVNDNHARIVSLETTVTDLQNSQPIVSDKTVVLQQGLADYSGTVDTTLTKTESDWSALNITGDQPTAEQFAAAFDSVNSYDVAIGMLRFDLSGLTSNMLEAGETCANNIVVMDANLVLRVKLEINGLMGVRLMASDSPQWIEAEANWQESSSGNPWPAGTFIDTPVLNSIIVENNEIAGGISPEHTNTVSLDTEYIKQWVCDSTTNNGFLIGTADDSVKIYSSEYERVSYRPKLKLILKKISLN